MVVLQNTIVVEGSLSIVDLKGNQNLKAYHHFWRPPFSPLFSLGRMLNPNRISTSSRRGLAPRRRCHVQHSEPLRRLLEGIQKRRHWEERGGLQGGMSEGVTKNWAAFHNGVPFG